MALSPSRPISTADVEEICQLRDDLYRNRCITLAYHDISDRLHQRIGNNASWCTFSTWSSRTIGENMRLDKPGRRFEEMVAEVGGRRDPLYPLLWQIQHRVRTRSDAAMPRLLAVGNRLVFHEIGYEVSRFLDWCDRQTAFDAVAWDKYRTSITPYDPSDDIFPTGDIELLRRGLSCYYQASFTDDSENRARLVLEANVLLAAYEQWRVDPILKAALDPWPGHFLDLFQLHPHTVPTVTLARAGTQWAARHRSSILRFAAVQFAQVMTRWFMTLDAPVGSERITNLRLGDSVPKLGLNGQRFPPPLDKLNDPELEQLLAVYDRSGPHNHAHTGARNWAMFPDRMNFIVNLFRAAQADRNLYRRLTAADQRIRAVDFSDQRLDKLRKIGDRQADDIIRDQCTASGMQPRSFVRILIQAGFHELTVQGTARADLPPWADTTRLMAGQAFFRRFGLEVASALFTASLPASYTGARGAQVLTTTATLVSNPARRVAETGRMLLDVMGFNDQAEQPLAPGSRGYEAARGVRLFHAAVRHMILTDPKVQWDVAKLGVPINQEDLLGTLAAFSIVVIEALDQMGVKVGVRERDNYLHLWLVVGHLLGIDYDLLYPKKRPPTQEPLTYAEMQLLANAISGRNAEPSPSGQELMAALFEECEQPMPWPLRGLAKALTRHFLSDEWADLMAVPPAGTFRLVANLLRPFDQVLSPFLHTTFIRGLSAHLTKRVYGMWIRVNHGTRPEWQLDEARKQWRLHPGFIKPSH